MANLPSLTKRIPTQEIQQKPKIPESLRKMLTKKELDWDESESFSGSEISDAFYDLHKGSVLSHAKGEKALTKKQADVALMQGFTEDFKKTIAEVRSEMQIGDSMMLETVDDIRKAQQGARPKHLPEPIKLQVDTSQLQEKIRLLPTSPTSSVSRKASTISHDANSGVWRMLVANCANKQFQITPPNFNAFKQKQPHWLDREAVPWQKLDDSKRKCENWLSKHHK